jgi:hypothetical protein
MKFRRYVQKKILKLLEFTLTLFFFKIRVYFKLFLSKSHEISQHAQKKILRLKGYKGHRVHTGGHVDLAFLGLKTCIFTL